MVEDGLSVLRNLLSRDGPLLVFATFLSRNAELLSGATDLARHLLFVLCVVPVRQGGVTPLDDGFRDIHDGRTDASAQQ